MKKNQEKLLLETCWKEKKYNEGLHKPSQFGDEIVASDIHRLTIISGEAPGQYEEHRDFPHEYRIFCPKIPDCGIVINGKELAKKLRAAMRFWTVKADSHSCIRMQVVEGGILFAIKKYAATARRKNSFIDYRFFLPCETAGKENLPHGGINGKYLLEAARHLDTFELSKEEGLRPFQIKAGNLEHYIMPLRV